MKKIIFSLLFLFTLLFSSFAVDFETIKKESKAFIADKDARAVEISTTNDNGTEFMFIPADKILILGSTAENTFKLVFVTNGTYNITFPNINSFDYLDGILYININTTNKK